MAIGSDNRDETVQRKYARVCTRFTGAEDDFIAWMSIAGQRVRKSEFDGAPASRVSFARGTNHRAWVSRRASQHRSAFQMDTTGHAHLLPALIARMRLVERYVSQVAVIAQWVWRA